MLRAIGGQERMAVAGLASDLVILHVDGDSNQWTQSTTNRHNGIDGRDFFESCLTQNRNGIGDFVGTIHSRDCQTHGLAADRLSSSGVVESDVISHFCQQDFII